MGRFHASAGIAIGPILFVIALLGILASVIAAGTGDFGVAGVSDRVYNDIYSQANLIRTKISECNLKWGTSNGNGDGWPATTNTSTGAPVCSLECSGDPSTATSGTDCAGNSVTRQNLWSGIRAALLPPPTSGFNQWYYVNDAANGGGRCIWTRPNVSNPSSGVVAGLTKAATKFSSQEVVYNPSGTTQNFVIWISPPTGSANSNCSSN